MAPGCCNVFSIISSFIFFLIFCPSQSVKFNHTIQPKDEANNLKHIRAILKKINKPPIKTIQNPDGDIIDCILSHQQLAFDHPLLKGQKPLYPPKRPRHPLTTGKYEGNFQIWSMSNESCPEGTIPVKRTVDQDIIRAGSVQRFGHKILKVDPDDGNAQEQAVGAILGAEYYGAKASINVWTPSIEHKREYSKSQMWILAGSQDTDLNSIEVGWQIYPLMYGDNATRLFIYWTRDSYNTTGCYNLQCPGFVQTNNTVVLGGAIGSLSSYNGNQVELNVYVFKDRKSKDWWLEVNGISVGYWPSSLFTNLKEGPSTRVVFGGEVLNYKTLGHTATGMGSGHFAGEGIGRASFFRNIEVKDEYDRLNPISDIYVFSERPECYSIEKRSTDDWGVHFYYGGPGRNPVCR